MKKFHSFITLLLFLSTCTKLLGQDNQIHFQGGDLVSSGNILNRSFKKENIQPALYGDKYYLLIKFDVLPSEMVKGQLRSAGMELGQYLPQNTFFTAVKNSFDFSQAPAFHISSVEILPSFYKTDGHLLNFDPQYPKTEKIAFAVYLFPGIEKDSAINVFRNMGAAIMNTKVLGDRFIFIQPDKAYISAITQLPFVSSITLQHMKDKILNYNDVSIHNISALHSPLGKNLLGKGVAVGVGDDADISTHIDFAGRLINRVAYFPDFHGTHTSGTTAGGGIINSRYTGIAPRATVISQLFSDIITNTPIYVTDFNMVATNNSYHSEEEGCIGDGAYDAFSNYIDDQMKMKDEVLHVFAAGNDGVYYVCSPYPNSFATIKSGWQSAKNVMTVGAIDQATYAIAAFSSRGPVNDGRIKPEIVTNGYGTVSTIYNNSYGLDWGTSMAAPVITGSTALFQERYRSLHGGANAKAALVKAMFCNTAEDLGNPGPDFIYGFGLLDLKKAVDGMENNQFAGNSISTGQDQSNTITVAANTRRLKIMIYWADPAAAVNAATTLINDLDLTVTDPSSTVHHPLVLNSLPAGANNNAVEGFDHTNNIEQVVIDNPAPGTYSWNVHGTAIPMGPQPYFITWQTDLNGVTVDYPFGGETMVTGEPEVIRWRAYGSESNTFSLEYSGDNGTSWALIDGQNNLPASTRSYAWTVPSTATNSALVRVTRNGSGYSDTSDFNFTILGLPTISSLNAVCPGYAELNWTAVTSATSYDVMQLYGDTMKVIGNTSSTTFLINGLDPNKTGWFSVRALNGSFPGKRAYAVSLLPNTGSCTPAGFNNDLKIDSILEPNTARLLYSNAANATKPVKIRIHNPGNTTVTGPYDVTYTTSLGTTATETINSSLAAGATLDYTFSTAYSYPAGGFRASFKSWVTKTGDPYHNNDTAYKWVKLLKNDTTILPFTEDFESFENREYLVPEMGLWGGANQDRFDFSSGTNRGRGRFFINSGIAHSGNKAFTLDQRPASLVSNSDSLFMSLNSTAFGNTQARMDFYYKNHGQDNLPGNKLWIRKSESDPWVMAYDLYANQADLNQWKAGRINLNELLGNNFGSGTFQVKFGQEGFTSANSAVQELDVDDGYSFDDISLVTAVNDVALYQLISPTMGCGLTGSNPIIIRLKNYSSASVTNIIVSYRINGGAPVSETITSSIAPGTTLDYTFTANANFSAYTDYTVETWAKYAGDSYAGNDSAVAKFHNSPYISSFPYLEGFENNNGNYYTKGANIAGSSWQWGAPVKTVINKAPNGSKVWVTNLTGNYKNNEISYLYSPCFNISSLSQPVLSFSHIFQVELDYDYTWVDYSTDGGISWSRLGNNSSGVNWYDDATPPRWRVSKPKWHVASYDLPIGASSLRLRWVMSSDPGVTYEGVGIDDIHIFDRQAIYTGPTVTGINQSVSGSNWIHFLSGGKRVASINPAGQNLGNTSINVYPYNGSTRYSNNQYYLNRNIVVHPAIQPSSPVTVRLYFTETESNLLLNAVNCGACTAPFDPYELGATKFNGFVEDGTLDDNAEGNYQFILPANTLIIPYDSGYYAEFSVNNFSELWISKASIAPALPNTCPGGTIIFTAVPGAATYQWQENTGSGFVNVSNGPNYAGVTTDSLHLISLPTSYSGYTYRCLVNGVSDNERTLRFVVRWNGSISTNWFNAANWDCVSVPDANVDVIIPGAAPNYPLINASTIIRSIKLNPASTVTVLTGINLNIIGR